MLGEGTIHVIEQIHPTKFWILISDLVGVLLCIEESCESLREKNGLAKESSNSEVWYLWRSGINRVESGVGVTLPQFILGVGVER